MSDFFEVLKARFGDAQRRLQEVTARFQQVQAELQQAQQEYSSLQFILNAEARRNQPQSAAPSPAQMVSGPGIRVRPSHPPLNSPSQVPTPGTPAVTTLARGSDRA